TAQAAHRDRDGRRLVPRLPSGRCPPMRPSTLAFALALAFSSVGASAAQPARKAPPPKPAPAPSPSPSPSPSYAAIPVPVVDAAATQAYIQPGSAGGVHRGATVTLGKQDYVVVQATSSYAVIDVAVPPIDKEPPREQDKGSATVVSEDAAEAR